MEFDDGVVDVRGESVEIAPGFPTTVAHDEVTGVPLAHCKILVDRGFSFERAKELLADQASKHGGEMPREGFYASTQPLPGRNVRSHILLIQKPMPTMALNWIPTFRIFRPATGLSMEDTYERIVGRYPPKFSKLTAEQAEQMWKRLYDEGKTVCSHGPNCKNGRNCIVGKRQQEQHILTGSVLPFWAKIKEQLDRTKNLLGRQRESKMRIVRVRCKKADGTEVRLVGIRLADQYTVDRLRSELNGSTSESKPEVKSNINSKRPISQGNSRPESSKMPGDGSSARSAPDVQRNTNGYRVNARCAAIAMHCPSPPWTHR